jgi:hypothetical protein
MSDAILKAFVMKPGIIGNLTKYEAEGGFVDGNCIRFRAARAEKIGGWVRETIKNSYAATGGFSSGFSNGFSTVPNRATTGGFSSGFSSGFNVGQNLNTFTGVTRAMKAWQDLSGAAYLASASNEKVELLYQNTIYDITPVVATLNLVNVISTTINSFSVQINAPSHNRTVGDFIHVNQANSIPVGGIVLYGNYQVITVIDPNNFTISAQQAASATVSSSGGTIQIQLLLPNGLADNQSNIGWGGSTYGTAGQGGLGWGVPRLPSGTTVELRQWSLDVWGEDLMAQLSGGQLYEWVIDKTFTTQLTPIMNAPTENNFMLVAQPSRQVVLFGTQDINTGVYDPLLIRWSDAEDNTDWTPTETNQAGSFRIPTGDFIVCAVQTKGEILVFTNSSVYAMIYVGNDNGLNDIFQFVPLATNISIMGPHSVIDVNGVVYWMGVDNFYMYNGIVQVLPTTLDKYVFSQFGAGLANLSQKEKCYCGMNAQFNEVWWFYPVSTEIENGHYIKYNWLENVMDYGAIPRTAWVDKSIFPKPYAMDPNGRLYSHEIGTDADGQPMDAFITTAYFDIDDGDNVLFINKFVPDLLLPNGGQVQVTLLFKTYPHPDADITIKGPFNFSDANDKISVRGRGRQMAVQFSCNTNGATFELGKMRIAYQADGERV